MSPKHLISTLFCVLLAAISASAQQGSQDQREFFESKIRPVLAEHCYACHNSVDTAEGGLVIDHRDALMRGGDGGLVVVEGKPGQSRLIKVLRHEIEGLEMPEGGPKLAEAVVRDFERWIRMGIPDPRDAPPSPQELAASSSWENIVEQRKRWWSFRPIADAEPPRDVAGTPNPIDRFVNHALEPAGLVPSPPADPATLVRRLYFNLTGLPPTRDEAIEWTRRINAATDRQASIGELVDQLLQSPRFGERWARHWMDWIRYAESHGSEGDPRIENAWHYRDYLIRALNQDVPYDQLVLEHLAGDLLKHPRVNLELGIDESAIGTAHLRMVFHGFAPTDALDEKVRFIDDQINVVSKAFLGLTVSCARCHDHKFDAISQADYYAMFGVFASCRPGRNVVDLPEKQTMHRERLAELKTHLRDAIASAWLDQADEVARRMVNVSTETASRSGLARILSDLKQADAGDADFETVFAEIAKTQLEHEQSARDFFDSATTRGWDMARDDDRQPWYRSGIGLEGESKAGAFSISVDHDSLLGGIYPAGIYTHGLSAKHPGRLTSPDFELGADQAVWVQVIGDNESSFRYVVQDYPRQGTVYPLTRLTNDWQWRRYDLSYWAGDSLHLEFATAKDAPLLTANQPRSWFGVRRIVVTDKDAGTPNRDGEAFLPVIEACQSQTPRSLSEFRSVLTMTITDAIQAWRAGDINDSQAILLDELLRAGALPNSTGVFPELAPIVTEYRQLEAEIPVPTRVPGLDESIGKDQPLMIRGNHKQLGPPVPRRFLEAIDANAYRTERSGRLELARDLLRDDNPLTRRVIVNRIWHHLFGRGIVSTPDNFGRLGNPPSHPELLDWLATRFAKDGWSIKRMIRRIVTSDTWQRSSVPAAGAARTDPENILLGRANVRRLEAEAIRDSLLKVSGRLENRRFGPPVNADSPRRSIYVAVIRNALDPFLRAFDFPEPFSTVGRRDVTNVPAQSLAIMNDQQIARYADDWTRRTLGEPLETETTDRVARMFYDAFGRKASDQEIERAIRFLSQTRQVVEDRIRSRQELANQIDRLETHIASLLDIARASLEEEASVAEGKFTSDLPAPIARWDLTVGLQDLVGQSDLQLQGDARQTKRGLLLKNGGHALSNPIGVSLSEKTLEVRVMLTDLAQRGGGAMTVQTSNGNVFDSIVFAEQQPRRWLAGSNNFARTEPFGGNEESEAVNQPIHFAITYHSDGRVTGYRNGNPYGRSYVSDGPQRFEADDTVVGLGVRHSPAGGNRLLTGVITQASLYDTALSAEEIAATASGSGAFVSDERLLEHLTDPQREQINADREAVSKLRAKLAATADSALSPGEQAWSELARALFSFQEFIYVR